MEENRVYLITAVVVAKSKDEIHEILHNYFIVNNLTVARIQEDQE